ncbi:MAG: hypothetical protein NT077_00645 [Candidatus Taylorbacteria bacterium]|nr:hypothetical protein [Candidatus Taylorbacteria bacterium]
MDILTAIFGNQAKVRILRLFLFNPESPFFLQEVVARTKCASVPVRKELSSLLKIGLLKKRLATKDIKKDVNSKEIVAKDVAKPAVKKVHGLGYALNTKFVYLDLLKNFLTVSSVSADESLLKKFANVGRLKLMVASGIFIQNWDTRVDLLIVGDELDLHRIEAIIKSIEAEIGKELAYSAFDTQDFEYRLGIHDRLIRDILDYPHVTLIDRLGVEPN